MPRLPCALVSCDPRPRPCLRRADRAVPCAVAISISSKPEQRIYALCGQLAQRLKIDPQRTLMTNVYNNNMTIHEHRNMSVSDSPHSVNILTRHRDVGNVFRLFRDVHSESGGRNIEQSVIRIIDHDRQRWVPISLGDALEHTEIFNPSVKEISFGNRGGQFYGAGDQSAAKAKDVTDAAKDVADQEKVIQTALARAETAYQTWNADQSPTKEGLRDAAQADLKVEQAKLPDLQKKLEQARFAAAQYAAIKPDLKNAAQYTRSTPGKFNASSTLVKYEMPHLHGGADALNNPLYDCYVFGDLRSMAQTPPGEKKQVPVGDVQLTMETIEDAVRSVKHYVQQNFQNSADQQSDGELWNILTGLCQNNVFTQNGWTGKANAPSGSRKNTHEFVVSASVDDLVGALQDSVAANIGGYVGDDSTVRAIYSGIKDVLSRAEDWDPKRRFATAEAFEQHSGDFASAAAALQALSSNASSSKQAGLTKKYIKAVASDFKSNWGAINASQKRIAASLPDTVAAPIGSRIDTGQPTFPAANYKSIKDILADFAKTKDPTEANAFQTNRPEASDFFTRNFARSLDAVETQFSGNNTNRLIARWWLGCGLTLHNVKSLDGKGIVTPFGCYIFRPWQGFNMGSAIVMHAGNDTGFTAVGNSDFQ